MTLDVRIEKLVYGGEGLAHYDGRTVFVPFVVPEETVLIEEVERRKKFVRGRVEQIVAPSPERTSPPCAHFGICGGCHYQHMTYEAQLRYKAEILRETLRRIGRVEWQGPIGARRSPPLGYRNRAQWAIRAAGENGRRAIGYFQAASDTLCAVDQCPLLSPRLAETLGGLQRLLEGGKLAEGVNGIEAFVDGDDGRLLLNISLGGSESATGRLAELLQAELAGIESVLVSLGTSKQPRMELFGAGFVNYRAGNFTYRVGHLSFFQVNRFLTEALIRSITGEETGRLALDLFAGVGFFSLPLAGRFERVIAVESNPAAARDLKTNIEESGTSAGHRMDDVEGFLSKWKERPDLVVLDPPRGGVSATALARLSRLAPSRIAYLSCDPATLARDLAVLTGGTCPYEIADVSLFDLFPQTYHIESLVRLRRRA